MLFFLILNQIFHGTFTNDKLVAVNLPKLQFSKISTKLRSQLPPLPSDLDVLFFSEEIKEISLPFNFRGAEVATGSGPIGAGDHLSPRHPTR